jgi:type I restriction enzyme S subunit
MNEITEENGYRETELGLLPKEWKIVKLEDIAELINGYSFKSKNYVAKSNTLLIRMSNIRPNCEFDPEYTEVYLPDSYYGKFSKFQIKDGDIIIAMTDMANNPKILGVPTIVKNSDNRRFLLNQRVGKISIENSEFDKYYLKYCLSQKSIQKYYISKAKKGVQVNIGKKDILSVVLPAPPFEEQKKIAGVLSAVQDAIEKTEAVIQATKDLKKSMMKHLFTYGPVPLSEKENVTLKETEIGMIPEEWELKKYKDIANINERNVNPKKDFPDKLFEYIDINSIDNSINKITETKSIFGKNAPSRARRLVRTNDVIISTVRPYLRSFAIVSKSYNEEVCSTGFSVLTSKATILPQYLFYVSISDIVIDQFRKQMRGANYPAINITNVRNTLIPLPTIAEQKQVSEILSSIDNKIQAEENKKKALEDLFNSLLHNLMTAKIRVNDLDLEGVEI